jgi:predicted RNase H-like HicB family nuclease
MSLKRYSIVIEPTSTGYSAFSPDVPGCAAAGDTEEETRRDFQNALAAHFEMMREFGEPIPAPVFPSTTWKSRRNARRSYRTARNDC